MGAKNKFLAFAIVLSFILFSSSISNASARLRTYPLKLDGKDPIREIYSQSTRRDIMRERKRENVPFERKIYPGTIDVYYDSELKKDDKPEKGKTSFSIACLSNADPSTIERAFQSPQILRKGESKFVTDLCLGSAGTGNPSLITIGGVDRAIPYIISPRCTPIFAKDEFLEIQWNAPIKDETIEQQGGDGTNKYDESLVYNIYVYPQPGRPITVVKALKPQFVDKLPLSLPKRFSYKWNGLSSLDKKKIYVIEVIASNGKSSQEVFMDTCNDLGLSPGFKFDSEKNMALWAQASSETDVILSALKFGYLGHYSDAIRKLENSLWAKQDAYLWNQLGTYYSRIALSQLAFDAYDQAQKLSKFDFRDPVDIRENKRLNLEKARAGREDLCNKSRNSKLKIKGC